MNKVLLIGRITKDPEIRYTQSGIPSVSFTLAVDRVMRDANGNRQADFINCVAWRGQADFISRFIKKGFLMSVEGKIQTRNYQAQDGQMRYVTEVVLDSVENLQPRDPNAQQVPYQQNGYQQPAQNYQQNNYQGYNNPSYGGNSYATGSTPTSQPETEAPESFNLDVADDDLPF